MAPATKKCTKWSPSWPHTSESKGPGEEERMLQAQLGPHPISILSSELHHPESLAPNSQLPLWSISRWRLHFTAFFRDTLTNKNKMEVRFVLCSDISKTCCKTFISGFAESLPLRLAPVTKRAEVTLVCLRRYEEMNAGRDSPTIFYLMPLGKPVCTFLLWL